MTMDDLMEMGSISKSAATFLRASVVARRSILVSGGTGSGKTTMLNVLSSFIPFKERIVTIEDTSELRLHQDPRGHAGDETSANIEGAGEYTIRDLVKNALRMRPDRVIVGECRGGEALDMIQAMNTGHDGSMTSVHANSRFPRSDRAAGSAGSHGGRSADGIHPPTDCVGHRLDRAYQPPAGRGPRRDADFRGRALRPGGQADYHSRYFQLSQRGLAAADRLHAVVHRLAGGEGLVGCWNFFTAGTGKSMENNPILGPLGCLC